VLPVRRLTSDDLEASFTPTTQDLSRTKHLLAEAGYPNGLNIVLNATQGRFLRDREVAA